MNSSFEIMKVKCQDWFKDALKKNVMHKYPLFWPFANTSSLILYVSITESYMIWYGYMASELGF